MEYENIIVRMPNWLGDVVMATPVLAHLRARYKKAKITAMCQYPGSELLLDDPHLDEVFAFKHSKPVFFRRDSSQSITDHIKIGHYDLGVLLTNSFSSAWWFFQGGVKKRIGYRNFPRNFLLTDSMEKPNKSVLIHQVDEYLNLLKLIDIKQESIKPKLYLKDRDQQEAKRLLHLYGVDLTKKVIGITPGASYGSAKCWPKEYFSSLLDLYVQQDPMQQFIFFGEGSQSDLIDEICLKHKKNTLNLAGKTTIRELMGMISLMELLLTNDSGPMHLAQALGVKVLALFGSTSFERTGPYQSGKILQEKVACSPCYKRVCPIDFPCMKNLTPEKVFFELKQMMER